MSHTQTTIFDAINGSDAPNAETLTTTTKERTEYTLSAPQSSAPNTTPTPTERPQQTVNPNKIPTHPAAYAQRALWQLMEKGEWYTVRQLSTICRLSDPRANIRTMKNRGYRFETRWEYNEHHVRYKCYRLIVEKEDEQ